MEDKSNETTATQPEEPKVLTPAQLLASIPGAPTAAQIDVWKNEVPNHRIKLFSPDFKRVYIVRGVSGLEVSAAQKSIPVNATDREVDFQLAICATAILWTNATVNHKMTVVELRAGSAGLPSSIFELVSELSDYVKPEYLAMVSGDL